jgi:lipase ATG15
MGFQLRHAAGKDTQHSRSDGPQYIEVHSKKLNLTVIAVRGTDLGRLLDFLEDVRLYSEPMIFHLLSVLFPTIRVWTSDTTSRVIEWMFQFNSFIGLQSESHYYRPLAARVLELTRTTNLIPGQTAENVIITGHSLGGGLARIVGSLTGSPSVSFAPPGLGLSYRKYSLNDQSSSFSSTGIDTSSTTTRAMSPGAVHHKSIAVITEFDW